MQNGANGTRNYSTSNLTNQNAQNAQNGATTMPRISVNYFRQIVKNANANLNNPEFSDMSQRQAQTLIRERAYTIVKLIQSGAPENAILQRCSEYGLTTERRSNSRERSRWNESAEVVRRSGWHQRHLKKIHVPHLMYQPKGTVTKETRYRDSYAEIAGTSTLIEHHIPQTTLPSNYAKPASTYAERANVLARAAATEPDVKRAKTLATRAAKLAKYASVAERSQNVVQREHNAKGNVVERLHSVRVATESPAHIATERERKQLARATEREQRKIRAELAKTLQRSVIQ